MDGGERFSPKAPAGIGYLRRLTGYPCQPVPCTPSNAEAPAERSGTRGSWASVDWWDCSRSQWHRRYLPIGCKFPMASAAPCSVGRSLPFRVASPTALCPIRRRTARPSAQHRAFRVRGPVEPNGAGQVTRGCGETGSGRDIEGTGPSGGALRVVVAAPRRVLGLVAQLVGCAGRRPTCARMGEAGGACPGHGREVRRVAMWRW